MSARVVSRTYRPAEYAGRWKVACINWGHPDAPHALTYFWDGREMRFEHYWPTWRDAMDYVSRRVALTAP